MLFVAAACFNYVPLCLINKGQKSLRAVKLSINFIISNYGVENLYILIVRVSLIITEEEKKKNV
jgi:uncharacterized membrane protein